jgi:hypothetical protein
VPRDRRYRRDRDHDRDHDRYRYRNLPAVLPFRDGVAAPEGYVRGTRMRKGLLIAGSTTTGALWLISMAVASAAEDNEGTSLSPLFAPVVGPFIAIGTDNPNGLGTFTLVIDGIGQAAGVAMFVLGVTKKEQVWRYEPLGSLQIAPLPLGRGQYGMGLSGAF